MRDRVASLVAGTLVVVGLAGCRSVPARSGEPFPGARVYQLEGTWNIVRTTNAEGIATFDVPESDDVTFLVDGPGFVPSALNYRLSRSCAARVTVSPAWLRGF